MVRKVPRSHLLQGLASPRFGFIKAVFEIQPEADDPPIFCVFVNMPDPGNFGPAFGSVTMENGAVGLNREAALTAALGECAERYALAQLPWDAVLNSWQTLAETAVKPVALDQLRLFSSEQINRPGFPYPDFDEHTPIRWTCLEPLDGGGPCLYPSCLIYVPYRPKADEALIGPSVSTGAACGMSKASAAVRGLYECIERDTFMTYWLNGFKPYEIYPENLDDVASLFRQKFDRPWLEYHLFLMENEFGVPVVLCTLRDHSRHRLNLMVGGAARGTLREAAVKALLEAVQCRYWTKHMRKTGQLKDVRDEPDRLRMFADHVKHYAAGYGWDFVKFFHENAKPLDSYTPSWPEISRSSAAAELEALVERLRFSGLRAFVLDLTTPDIESAGLVVIKTVVPGLINLNDLHIAPYLGLNRLDSAAAKLGQTGAFTRAEGFNPYPHPYP